MIAMLDFRRAPNADCLTEILESAEMPFANADRPSPTLFVPAKPDDSASVVSSKLAVF